MIPKIIHYCWFGTEPEPNYLRICLASWHKYFPDFQILKWSEANTSFEHPFLKKAVREKKWAFVSDFIRLQKLYEMGGVYLDTDMLFIRSFPDELLQYDAFLGVERRNELSAGIIGSVPNGKFLTDLYSLYLNNHDPDFFNFTIPKNFTRHADGVNFPVLQPQMTSWGLILDKDVFYPLPMKLKQFHWNRFIQKNTLAVHLWAGSWLNPTHETFSETVVRKIKYQLSRIYIPESFLNYARSL